jgi:hypothetical protein
MRKKIIIVIIVLVILAAATFFIIEKVKKEKSANGSSTGGTSVAGIFPLRLGSRGNEVKILQQRINKVFESNLILAPPAKLAEDGIFGAKTENALSFIFNMKQITKNQYNKFVSLTEGILSMTTINISVMITQVKNA